MFTGIIEAVGSIVSNQARAGDVQLRIDTAGLDLQDVKLGDSIATNGVCLTVVALHSNGFSADVSNETLRNSSLAKLGQGAKVNLEKAMQLNDRFGGHIVSGHVDGIGEVLKLDKDARSVRIEIASPANLQKYIAAKGSITIDGVSLTVNQLSKDGFCLNIVPHTAAETIICDYALGSTVNIEIDVIARYVEQLFASRQAQPNSAIDKAFLREHGFYK